VPDLGDVVPLTVEIRDAAGVLAAAGAITLTVTLPDGTVATPSVSNPSTGRYQVDYPTTQVGRHTARWVATGANSSAYVDVFDVRPADPGYIISLAAAKAALNIPATSTGDDEEIRALIEAVTAVVEDYRKEAVVRRTVVERISARGSSSILLKTAPVISVTSVASGSTTWTGLTVDPDLGEVSSAGAPFTGDLTVTYVAGRAVIPANFVEAAKVIVKHLWAVQQTPGMGSRVMGVGGDDISAGIAGLGFALPNRAAELLGGRGVICA
jgi:hypothetical protein